MTAPREAYFRTRDGLRLFYRDYPGDARRAPVLCLPGLTRNSKDFLALAEHIAPARRVIAPDQRGRGRSDRDAMWMRYTPTVYVDDMLSLLAELRLDRVIVVGTSLGGLMAMLIAMVRPQALVGVMLNDVGPELDPRGLNRIRSNTGRMPAVRNWNEAAAQVRALSEAQLPDLTAQEWLEQARKVFREDADGVPHYEADPKIGDAVRLMPGDTGKMMWAAFAALEKIPTLLIRGEHSDLLSTETVDRMRRAKADLQVVTVPNRGHVPLLNEPVCIAAMDGLFAGLA